MSYESGFDFYADTSDVFWYGPIMSPAISISSSESVDPAQQETQAQPDEPVLISSDTSRDSSPARPVFSDTESSSGSDSSEMSSSAESEPRNEEEATHLKLSTNYELKDPSYRPQTPDAETGGESGADSESDARAQINVMFPPRSGRKRPRPGQPGDRDGQVIAVKWKKTREAVWRIQSSAGHSRFVAHLPRAYFSQARQLAISLLSEISAPDDSDSENDEF